MQYPLFQISKPNLPISAGPTCLTVGLKMVVVKGGKMPAHPSGFLMYQTVFWCT
jgi:hypothetical protein